jgi:hypothetical protein
MPRTKSVLLRLTEEEHSRLKELAGREPVSAYLRRVALSTGPGNDVMRRAFEEAKGVASESRSATAKDSDLRTDAPSPPQRPSQHKWASEKGKPSTPFCKCPVSSCDYRAGSLAARCPRHGRLVVPA